MSVKERIIEFIKYKGISNSEFCRSIGVSAAFISSMRQSIQPDKIKSIAFNYPDLSIKWLLTGEEEMLTELNEPQPEYKKPSDDDMKNKLIKALEELLLAKEEIKHKNEKIATLEETIRNFDKYKKRADEIISDGGNNLNE